MRIVDVAGTPARIHAEGDAGTALLLPGASYPADGPLLWYSGRAAALHGWEVLAVTGPAPQDDAAGWSERMLDGLAGRAADRPALVVAKDRSCAGVPGALDRDIPGVWFTPDLHDERIAAALATFPARGLVVGATEDGTWDVRVAARIRGFEVLQLGGPDGNLEDPGDPRRSLALLGRVVERVAALVARISG